MHTTCTSNLALGFLKSKMQEVLNRMKGHNLRDDLCFYFNALVRSCIMFSTPAAVVQLKIHAGRLILSKTVVG